MQVLLRLLLACCVCAYAACDSPESPHDSIPLETHLQVTHDYGIAVVPLDEYFNLIYVPGSLNGKDSCWFIWDTGFEYSLLNRDRLGDLGIQSGDTYTESQPGGDVEVTSAYAITIDFGDVEMRADSMRALPLAGLEPVVGRPIHGIIGHDLFLKFAIEVDYEQQQLTVLETARFSPSEGGQVVNIFIENDEVFVYGEVLHPDGTWRRAKLKLDTGSADFIGFNGSYVQSQDLVNDERPRIPALGTAVGGHTENWVTRIDRFRLGATEIEHPVVGYSVDTLRGGDAGTIGGGFLHRFHCWYDYRGGRLALMPNRYYHDPVEYDMSGIFPIAAQPDFATKRVLVVTPGSVAEDADVRPNDILVSIDGTPANQLSIETIRQIFMQDGREVTLVIDRNGDSMETTLLLKRMI